MNKTVAILFALIACGLGAGLVAQKMSENQLRTQFAEIQDRLEEQIKKDAEEINKLKEMNSMFKSEAEQLRNRLAAKGGSADTPGEGGDKIADTAGGAKPEDKGGKKRGGAWGADWAEMMKDPEMKKAMRSQQLFGIKMIYTDLAKELGLKPDEVNQLMEMLVDRQMDATATAVGETDPAKMEAAAADAQKAMADRDAQIANYLGADKMGKFKEYEKTLGDRWAMQQYQQSLSTSGVSLNDTQRGGLMDIMKQERSKTPATAFDPGNRDMAKQMRAMRDGNGLDEYIASQTDYNTRVLARAREVLTPDQMTAFESAQQQQLDMIKMGMKMSQKMMGGGDKSGGK